MYYIILVSLLVAEIANALVFSYVMGPPRSWAGMIGLIIYTLLTPITAISTVTLMFYHRVAPPAKRISREERRGIEIRAEEQAIDRILNDLEEYPLGTFIERHYGRDCSQSKRLIGSEAENMPEPDPSIQ